MNGLQRLVFFLPVLLIVHDVILDYIISTEDFPLLAKHIYVFLLNPVVYIGAGYVLVCVWRGKVSLESWLDRFIGKIFFPLVYITSIPIGVFAVVYVILEKDGI